MSSVPPQVEANRRRACGVCLSRCQAYLSGQLSLGDPGARCPHPQGARWLPFRPGEPVPPSATLGAGTAFSYVAQPVARGVDAVFGTNLRNCGGCVGPGGRKERWDRAVPDIFHPLRRG